MMSDAEPFPRAMQQLVLNAAAPAPYLTQRGNCATLRAVTNGTAPASAATAAPERCARAARLRSIFLIRRIFF
jgi:hypothetical protein